MRKWVVLIAATSFVLGAAGVAGAAPMNWSGTGKVIIADIPEFTFTGGGVATVNNSAGPIPAHLSTLRLKGSRGQISGIDTEFLTDPETAGNGLAGVIVNVQMGTGTFSPISGAAGTSPLVKDMMPIFGIAKMCILSTICTQYLDMPFTAPTTTVNGEAGPGINAVGVGGLITAGGFGGIRISLQGAPWTMKTVTVVDQITTPGKDKIFTEQTVKGWAHDPGSATSTTAQVDGVVQLVTPAQIVSNIPLGSNDKLSGMVIMVVHFIPEPGLLLLLGAGVVGLAVLGRRRMR